MQVGEGATDEIKAMTNRMGSDTQLIDTCDSKCVCFRIDSHVKRFILTLFCTNLG